MSVGAGCRQPQPRSIGCTAAAATRRRAGPAPDVRFAGGGQRPARSDAGEPWLAHVAHDFPPCQTVHCWFRRRKRRFLFRTLHDAAKRVVRRKWHRAENTDGRQPMLNLTPADVAHSKGAPAAGRLCPDFPRRAAPSCRLTAGIGRQVQAQKAALPCPPHVNAEPVARTRHRLLVYLKLQLYTPPR